MSGNEKIILDCDPGHDDFIAIILACASNNINLLGITTVAGNQILEKTYINVFKALNLIREENIPVYKGSNKPIIRELKICPEIHGDSGIDGAELMDPIYKKENINAIDFIINTLLKEEDPINIVAIGPLTNIAIALLKEPRIKDKIKKIVTLGGGIHDSNITPSAEFNIYVDPEAAKIVYNSGLNIVMIPVDITNRAIFNFDDIKNIENIGNQVSKKIALLLQYFAERCIKQFNLRGAPLHDPLAVAFMINNKIIKTKKLNVEIETGSELTRGATIVDVYGVTNRPLNAEVAIDFNLNKYKNIIIDALNKF